MHFKKGGVVVCRVMCSPHILIRSKPPASYLDECVSAYDQQLGYRAGREYVTVGLSIQLEFIATSDDYQQ